MGWKRKGGTVNDGEKYWIGTAVKAAVGTAFG
jgi:hypothetical protein